MATDFGGGEKCTPSKNVGQEVGRREISPQIHLGHKNYKPVSIV